MEKDNVPDEDLQQNMPVTEGDSTPSAKQEMSMKSASPAHQNVFEFMDPLEDSTDPDPMEETSEEEVDPDSEYLPEKIKPTTPPVGVFTPTPCQFRRRNRKYKKVDRSLPLIRQCRQKTDGTWIFHPKLTESIWKSAKDSHNYRDLKAKRFNTSFLKNHLYKKAPNFEIFPPGETAGVPMPFIPRLSCLTGEPGQQYADAFRFLPRNQSDEDEKKKKNKKKRNEVKRGRRKSNNGKPYEEEDLFFNYDWLLEPSSSSEDEKFASPSTSKTE